jgi:radical SAM protein with 4Fe4S-binding SPASM domain
MFRDFERLKDNVPKSLHSSIDWDTAKNEVNHCYENLKQKSNFVPRVYQLEITNFCNLKCKMCPYSKMTRKKQHMTWKLFKKIIDKDIYFKQALEFHLFGEPLLHPKLSKFIKYAKSKGHIVGLATNATLLTKEKSKELLETGLDNIVLALDGANKETYEGLRQGGKYDVVVKNIKSFLKLKHKGNYQTYSVLQIIQMPETKNEIRKFKQKWSWLIGKGLNELRIKRLFDSLGGSVNSKIPFPQYVKRLPCSELWYGSCILSNGDVVPCGRDFNGKIVFGNLENQSLKQIFNSKKYQAFRKSHLRNNYSNNKLCVNCKEWDLINLRHVSILSCNLLKGDNTRYKDVVCDPGRRL